LRRVITIFEEEDEEGKKSVQLFFTGQRYTAVRRKRKRTRF